MLELKRLAPDAVEAAQEKAMRYRLLNKPRLAESICRDILAVDPDNAEAIVTLILALTDQYGMDGGGVSIAEATALVARLEGEYERQYYSGIVCERRAIAQLAVPGASSGQIVYDWLRRAMAFFERAEELGPPGHDDALLRWNTCARLINSRNDIRPAPRERMADMLE
jgi:hypothetical protein